MYNSEQKQTFLNTITNDNSYRSFQRVFKAVQDMEEKFGKRRQSDRNRVSDMPSTDTFSDERGDRKWNNLKKRKLL